MGRLALLRAFQQLSKPTACRGNPTAPCRRDSGAIGHRAATLHVFKAAAGDGGALSAFSATISGAAATRAAPVTLLARLGHSIRRFRGSRGNSEGSSERTQYHPRPYQGYRPCVSGPCGQRGPRHAGDGGIQQLFQPPRHSGRTEMEVLSQRQRGQPRLAVAIRIRPRWHDRARGPRTLLISQGIARNVVLKRY